MRRRLIIAALAALALAALGATLAGAAKQKPKNGGFESGDFSRWSVLDLSSDGDDTWYVYSGTELPAADGINPRPLRGGMGPPETFFAPPQGNFAAVTAQSGAGTHILNRLLKLKKDMKHKLKLRVFYENSADTFASPQSLDSEGEFSNQQYRIDVLRRNAPLDSVEDDDILKEVFGTQPGDPFSQAPKKVSVNLTKFAGKRVRLRLAEVDNELFFNAGVDAVKLKSKPEK